jgi:4-diphosphocytidyl-2-C-methyl-D-erythritol kinase
MRSLLPEGCIHNESVRAPAKVNLCLRVVGRRADGYHLLDSLMLPISLFDELRVRVEPLQSADTSSRISVSSDSPEAPGGPANLAYRAAALFLDAIGCGARVDIHLTKNIPVGAGLGGGSSDAAAVLCRLNRLGKSPLGTAELATLATQLGSDVAFFVYGRPAQVSGVGDRVEPLPFSRSLSLVVCSDGYVLATKQVYARMPTSLTTHLGASRVSRFVSGETPLPEFLINDLEGAAAQIHPGVLSLKSMLANLGALGTLMAGSGSAVFGVWPSAESAANAAETLRQRGLWAQSVQTLLCSPVVES